MPLDGSKLGLLAENLEFADFLLSDDYLEYCTDLHAEMTRKGEDQIEISLLDIIEQWALNGTIWDLCPTYEAFLRVVLNLVVTIGDIGFLEGASLWHKGAPAYEPFGEPLRDGHNPFNLCGYHHPFDHPVLDRHRFEMEKARRAADRNKRLDALLAANGH